MGNLYKIEPDSGAFKLSPGAASVAETDRFTTSSSGPTINSTPSRDVSIENAPSSTSATINFVEKFKNWTVSPIINDIYKSDIKIPDIHLKEKKLISSTLWEQFKYFAYIGKTYPTTTADNLPKFPILQKIADTTQKIVDTTTGAAKTLLEKLNFDTPDFTNQAKEDPYEGIYALEDTGFNYIFPLYTTNMRNKNNMYSDSYSGDGKGFGEKLATSITGFTESHAQGLRAIVEPGLYIEKTQFYNFGQSRESITFSFPLLNTISPEQIDENYQFLFLILFQNSLYRKDRSAFIPPCIYEVLIPNIRYMKYAYISNLSIDFIGTRRMITVNTPTLQGNTVKTIVPEAYNVNMTITGLHDEVGNFLIRAGSDDIGGITLADLQETTTR